MTQTPDDILFETVFGQMPPPLKEGMGVAVSGGGDSMALMYILAEWARIYAVPLHVVTVDHGLRPEAATEADQVATHARDLGLTHDTLRWTGWDGSGNLSDQARRARYRLIRDWAEARKLSYVAVGHTADDQAETFLMRLSRAAGVDGLSGMSTRRRIGSIEVLRPLLAIRREDLRRFLTRRGLFWIDDPTNDDARYDRIKARQALDVLEPLGISVPTLVTVAANLAEARKALDWFSFLSAREMIRIEEGDIEIDRRHFRTLADEIARRLLLRSLNWVSRSEYGPRQKSLALLQESIRGGTGFSLHGCRAVLTKTSIVIVRDLPAVYDLRGGQGELWDGRWRLHGPWEPGIEVRALGQAGLTQCPEWRSKGLPAAVLMPRPAVWRGAELIAAPLAGWSQGWQAEFAYDSEEFFSGILSH